MAGSDSRADGERLAAAQETASRPPAVPQRIQLSRRSGYRLQEASRALNGLAARRVTRPGPFANPVRIGGVWDGEPIRDAARAVQLFREGVESGDPRFPSVAAIRAELAGLNLACVCALDAPCHADVELRIANAAGPGGRTVRWDDIMDALRLLDGEVRKAGLEQRLWPLRRPRSSAGRAQP